MLENSTFWIILAEFWQLLTRVYTVYTVYTLYSMVYTRLLHAHARKLHFFISFLLIFWQLLTCVYTVYTMYTLNMIGQDLQKRETSTTKI